LAQLAKTKINQTKPGQPRISWEPWNCPANKFAKSNPFKGLRIVELKHNQDLSGSQPKDKSPGPPKLEVDVSKWTGKQKPKENKQVV